MRANVRYSAAARVAAICLLAAGGVEPSAAAVFCVGTAADLQSALSQAASTPQDDEIRLRAGGYTPAQTLVYNSTNNGWLQLTGGWYTADDNPCGAQSHNAASTALDGGGQRQVLLMAFNALAPTSVGPRWFISNLTIAYGVGVDFQRGGALHLSSTADAHTEYWLDNLIIVNNSGYFAGGVNLYARRGLVRVVNSLFRDNDAPTSAYGHLSITVPATDSTGTAVLVANSTFAYGSCAGSGSRGCGIGAGLGDGVRMDVVNSLFWENAISDVNLEDLAAAGLGTGTAFYDRSRVPTTSGNLVPTVTEALVGDPLFESAAGRDFRLSDASPFINRGRATLPIFGYLGYDIGGYPRTRFGTIDPGAYENQTWDFLFADGFQE